MAQHPQHLHSAKVNKDVLIADMGYDLFEVQTLEVTRYFLETFCSPDSQSWILAFQWAEHFFDVPVGATIANAIVGALDNMRKSRSSVFRFTRRSCACCKTKLTQEERYFISALHYVRRNKRSEAHMNAMLLCDGNDPTALLEALDRLAQIAGDISRPRAASIVTYGSITG